MTTTIAVLTRGPAGARRRVTELSHVDGEGVHQQAAGEGGRSAVQLAPGAVGEPHERRLVAGPGRGHDLGLLASVHDAPGVRSILRHV
ncbi:MAG TPA: hypothetical protein VH969_03765 [Actinophytocola sp.]|uniref:hypothetical protein n=1 Tax=Actinophytocola sp. TaxID=1872138 RepID=UPI002F943CFA